MKPVLKRLLILVVLVSSSFLVTLVVTPAPRAHAEVTGCIGIGVTHTDGTTNCFSSLTGAAEILNVTAVCNQFLSSTPTIDNVTEAQPVVATFVESNGQCLTFGPSLLDGSLSWSSV